MSVVWIIHRDPRMRAAIARLSAASEDTVLGAPGDPLFEAAPPADVVLIGLAELGGDFEPELQFVHRNARRMPGAAWILMPEPEHAHEVRRLFDAIDAEVLNFPPDVRSLQWRLHSAPSRRGGAPLPLSQRPARDALTARFALWFADLENPEIMRAIDPRLADVPLMVGGEPGTGRALMVRYVHSFGGTSDGALVRVTCTAKTRLDDIIDTLASRARTERARIACTIWLEDVDRLPDDAQRELRSWMEFAPPEGLIPSYRVRWIGTRGDPLRPFGHAEAETHLDPGLEQMLSTLAVRIPPLRERPMLTVPFAQDTAQSWCAARSERPRRFDDEACAALHAHTWPGNLAELEAVVVQSLSAGSANPLRASDLRYAGHRFGSPTEIDWGAAQPHRDAEPASLAPSEDEIDEVIDVLDVVEESDIAPDEQVPAEQSVVAPRDIDAAAVSTAPEPAPGIDAETLRGFADALSHEIRNPLSSIRTFAQLLPERFEDVDFRDRFADVVNRDVDRIARVLEHLSRFAASDSGEPEPVDATGLFEQLIEARRGSIRERRLLVLTELDHDRPLAFGRPRQLQLAFESVIDQALEIVEPRGDLYFASRYHETGLAGRPSIRILVRCGTPPTRSDVPPAALTSGFRPIHHSLNLAIAEAIVTSQGGVFTVDSSPTTGHLIILDLPAPAGS